MVCIVATANWVLYAEPYRCEKYALACTYMQANIRLPCNACTMMHSHGRGNDRGQSKLPQPTFPIFWAWTNNPVTPSDWAATDLALQILL